MKETTSNAPPGYTLDTLRRYVEVLPTGVQLQLLDERAAQAARSFLGKSDPEWERRLHAQIDSINKDISSRLDYDQVEGRYILSDSELRGIVARAVTQASGQCAIEIGQALTLRSSISELFEVSAGEDSSNGSNYKVTDLPQSI